MKECQCLSGSEGGGVISGNQCLGGWVISGEGNVLTVGNTMVGVIHRCRAMSWKRCFVMRGVVYHREQRQWEGLLLVAVGVK